MFQNKKIPLHKVAILAPTRGYLKITKGISKYKGLCDISNLLFKHNIPFKQFYNDSSSLMSMEDPPVSVGKISYKIAMGHVNLMTYTASKGLEWDYVIIIDANAHLISFNDYDVDKFNAEKYLLYVACSRPRKNLIILSKDCFTNPWFKERKNIIGPCSIGPGEHSPWPSNFCRA
jgi:superfamily I DNA/RNA helicase